MASYQNASVQPQLWASKDNSKKKKSGLPTTQAAETQPVQRKGLRVYRGAHAGVHIGFPQPGPSSSVRLKVLGENTKGWGELQTRVPATPRSCFPHCRHITSPGP